MLLALSLVFVAGLRADNSIQITVNPGAGRIPISPYIYGTNQDLPGVATPGSRRDGGNRLTGYNWETNASNAGMDWYNSSDNFMVSGLPASQQSTPAIALTLFHDQSLAMGTPYTVLTLQMAGYVAADESGTVTASQAAPSSRWNVVVNNTPGGVFSASPNLTDGTVYMDELLNLLVTKYGNASTPNGIKGYDLDNEPDLWASTHPLLHPALPTCAEIVSKSTALAQTVKRMDPHAEVLGLASYGSNGYFTFQNAPDWASIQTATAAYRWFLDFYLDQMNKASTAAGMRLLDVLDLHRYSDDAGGTPSESITNQTDYSTNVGCNQERVQAPRALWDPTFVENSWVQQWDSQFLPWIPNIQSSIAKYNPGTKLAFTEYSYGGESDISGGIAQADVLGIYGKYGVHLGCLWLLHGTPSPLYVSAAFNLYLNYDGNGGKFGATSVTETDSDTVNSSAYASIDAANGLHLVVLNKSYTATTTFTFQIAGSTTYSSAQVYAFDANGTAITLRAPAAIANNQFNYPLPPLTAAHFFLSATPSSPAISSQPSSQTSTPGKNVVFSATASGNPLPTYQWQRQVPGAATWTNLSDTATYSGSSTATLTVNTVVAAMNGDSFRCVITNSAGTATTTQATLVVDTPLTVVTLAGVAGASGNADGSGSAARFANPSDVAVDNAGNLFVADTANHTVRKVTPAGVVTIFAGQAGVSGSNDGSSTATFNRPTGITVDIGGNVYVADTNNNEVRKVTAAGVVSKLAGMAGASGSADGSGSAARFNGPSGIVADTIGNLYVADTLNHTIRKITAAGGVTTIAGAAGASGFVDATGSAARFRGPQGLALDASGNLYVADTNNNAIRKLVTSTGVVTSVAGQTGIAGSTDGANSQAQFHFPSGVAVDSAGNLYIADTDNHSLREITASGAVSTLAGLAGVSGSADGSGTAARFAFPTGVAADSSGSVYIADTNNDTIRLAFTPAAPSITQQPQSQTATAGANVAFSVTSTGKPAPIYQWYFGGSMISGATSSTLALTNVQFANAGSYTVAVTNSILSITSNAATLTVNPVSTSQPSGSGSSSGGGGGGGGAPSVWFFGALSLLAFAARMRHQQ
jgi:Glycoside hydrolase family 44/Immunoglobulin domain/NHL repeat